LHAHEWLGSLFAHYDFTHLVGNMFFLWAFGLVVEGKLGWQRFLCCYFAIGVGQSALEQVAMLGYRGDIPGSMGASAAIFGLMAMACLWAPANNLKVFMFFGFYYFAFDISVGLFAAIYAGFDLLSCLMAGAGAITSVLHLMGGAIGAVFGYLLLKRDLVDCNDYDLFSIMKGEYGAEKQRKREGRRENDPEREAALREAKRSEQLRKFEALLEIGKPIKALAVRRRMSDLGCPLELGREQLLHTIVSLHKSKRWAASAPVMAEFLERFPQGSHGVRLKLAQICLMELEKPGKTLELLQPLDGIDLPEPHEKLRQKLDAVANRRIDQGVLEVDDGGW
jgi:membrane associated rhomboid family serine protease